jgi:hypothetical protein
MCGGGTEINIAIVTIDEPFYTPTVIGTLVRNSPSIEICEDECYVNILGI